MLDPYVRITLSHDGKVAAAPRCCMRAVPHATLRQATGWALDTVGVWWLQGHYFTSFRAPDVYGVYKFTVTYHKQGYTALDLTQTVCPPTPVGAVPCVRQLPEHSPSHHPPRRCLCAPSGTTSSSASLRQPTPTMPACSPRWRPSSCLAVCSCTTNDCYRLTQCQISDQACMAHLHTPRGTLIHPPRTYCTWMKPPSIMVETPPTRTCTGRRTRPPTFLSITHAQMTRDHGQNSHHPSATVLSPGKPTPFLMSVGKHAALPLTGRAFHAACPYCNKAGRNLPASAYSLWNGHSAAAWACADAQLRLHAHARWAAEGCSQHVLRQKTPCAASCFPLPALPGAGRIWPRSLSASRRASSHSMR